MAREENFFDELARGLADGSVTRGKALRLMGSALVGTALASVPGVAWANDRCPEGESRCNDRCVNLQTNERHCGSCRNRCGSTQTCCGGRYVNLKRSERHCGSCSNRCEEGQECIDGVCGGGCPSGTVECLEVGNTCVPECPDGQIVDCPTSQCFPACTPDQPCCRECCCSCTYFDANNNAVHTCEGGFPRNNNAC